MRNLLLTVCTFICFLGQINAAIHKCETIEEVLPYLYEATSSTFVVFDIDDTLITKKEKVLRPSARDYLTGCYFRLIQRHKFDHLLFLISIVERFAQPVLVSDSWPDIITSLQSVTPYVLAHTSAPPKKLGTIENFPEARRELLNSFGIDFSSVSEIFPDMELKEVNHIPDVYPLMHSGMLFSENYSKGESFAALLKRCEIVPDRVIFVDDHSNNLRSVEKELTKMGIPFTGIHFEEASLFKDRYDDQIAEVQYYYLVQKHEWLNDEEAEIILKTTGVPQNDENNNDDSEDEFADDGQDDSDEIWSF